MGIHLLFVHQLHLLMALSSHLIDGAIPIRLIIVVLCLVAVIIPFGHSLLFFGRGHWYLREMDSTLSVSGLDALIPAMMVGFLNRLVV